MTTADPGGPGAALPPPRTWPLRETLRLPGRAARLLPTLPAVRAHCRALGTAYATEAAPLLPGGASGPLARRLLPWAVKGGVLVLRYAGLTGHPADPALAALAGAFTRLYDDALDEGGHPTATDPLGQLMTGPVDRPGGMPRPGPPDGHPARDGAVALFLALRSRTDPARHRTAYAALPRLHEAQLASLRRTGDRAADPHDLLRASRHKGGLGMLVLGGLVQPDPTPAQRDALLALGGFLQLVDDYEDRAADRAAGLDTPATRGALPLGLLHAELFDLEARLTALYGPHRARWFTDGLACWLHLTAVTRLMRGRRPPPTARPGSAGPPAVAALFTRREVIR
jgi:hypothetical protein